MRIVPGCGRPDLASRLNADLFRLFRGPAGDPVSTLRVPQSDFEMAGIGGSCLCLWPARFEGNPDITEDVEALSTGLDRHGPVPALQAVQAAFKTGSDALGQMQPGNVPPASVRLEQIAPAS